LWISLISYIQSVIVCDSVKISESLSYFNRVGGMLFVYNDS